MRDPLKAGFAWRVWPDVQIDRMNTAAKGLIGSHDFGAFGSPTTENGVTVREVYSAEWSADGDGYNFDIIGNAFLFHMVRRIAFVLVSIGQGAASVDLIAKSIKSGQLTLTGLAPAAGLVLEAVGY
jgi:tRNA pseudouridine38-40 synthase